MACCCCAGGAGRRGEKSRLTLAKIVRGIASGEVRDYCEKRDRELEVSSLGASLRPARRPNIVPEKQARLASRGASWQGGGSLVLLMHDVEALLARLSQRSPDVVPTSESCTFNIPMSKDVLEVHREPSCKKFP